MLTIVVTERGGEERRLSFEKDEVTVGRIQGNDIVLPKGNVSKRHSRLVAKDGKWVVVDLKSTNGTYVNGRRIASPQVVRDSDKIFVGDFVLQIDFTSGAEVVEDVLAARSEPAAASVGERKRTEAMAIESEEAEVGDDDIVGEAPSEDPRRRAPPSPPVVPPARMKPQTTAPPRPGPPAPPAPPLASAVPPPVGPLQVVEQLFAEDRASEVHEIGEDEVLDEKSISQVMVVEPSARPSAAEAPREAASPSVQPRRVSVPTPRVDLEGPRVSAPNLRANAGKQVVLVEPDVAAALFDTLVDELKLAQASGESLADPELRARATSRLLALLSGQSPKLPVGIDRTVLTNAILAEAMGIGPLAQMLDDGEVDALRVQRPDVIFVERKDKWERVEARFSGPRALAVAAERLIASAGSNVVEEGGLVDATLASGVRVQMARPPVAASGVTLLLRKPRRSQPTLEDLVTRGVLAENMAMFLATAVGARRNILVSGARGTGKTAVLGALVRALTHDESVVAIEDSPELTVPLEGLTRFTVGPGASAQTLVRFAKALRPSRLVLGEVAGVEACDLLMGMTTALEGSMTSLQAASPREAMSRLQTLAAMGAAGIPAASLVSLCAQALPVVVHVTRFSAEACRVTQIAEVVGLDQERCVLQDLFVFRLERVESDGTIRGKFVATGTIPRFYEDLKKRGVAVELGIFK